MKVMDGGKIIIVTSGPRLLIGSTSLPQPSRLKELAVVWREFECPEWISSLDVRVVSQEAASKKAKKDSINQVPRLDIAVGGLKGAIYVYEDLHRKLAEKKQHSKSGKSDDIRGRKLHWHRNAILCLKWSADGRPPKLRTYAVC